MPASHQGPGHVIRPTLDVASFVREKAGAAIELSVLAGHGGLENLIEVPRIQKLSLALTGFTRQIRAGRLQIVGETEILYCAGLASEQLTQVFEAACRVPVCAFLVTKGLTPPKELLEQAEAHDVPVLWCGERSSTVIDQVQRYLEDRLAARTTLHGVLLEVFGLGVLLKGDSGVGKSECALEMIQRGHRLVADDVVEIRRLSHEVLMGQGAEVLRHHMELRGIGIINIKDLFGVAAVRNRKRVELVVKLVKWQDGAEYERLGIDDRSIEIVGVQVPYVEMPVASGRNVAILLEVAARSQMLKLKGYHPARSLVEQLDAALMARPEAPGSPRPAPASAPVAAGGPPDPVADDEDEDEREDE